MNTKLSALMKRNPLLSFCLLAFGISWLVWVPGVLVYLRLKPEGFPTWMLLLAMLGAYGPTFAALIVSAVMDGSQGVNNLLKKLTIWRVKWTWYLVALLSPAVLLLLSLAIFRLLGGYPGAFNATGLPMRILLMVLFALPFGPLGEELGWRGFALPHLQRENGAMVSSIILGALWTFWHTPLFFVPGAALPSSATLDLVTIGIYLISTIGTAVLFTWVYNNTAGSVLLAILFHMAFNASGNIFFSSFPAITPAVVEQISQFAIILKWVLVIVVLQVFGERYLAHKKPVVESSGED